jgi:cyclic dehypoxanthinyl futalosine synthase
MMFGHVETIAERFIHLEKIRVLQAEKPADSLGFTAFILWPFQDEGTKLKRVRGVRNQVTPTEYVRMLALSRLMLPNISNIQVSWLTVGPEVAQICLHAGANDMGSIMIEENVVSAAGHGIAFLRRRSNGLFARRALSRGYGTSSITSGSCQRA